MEGAVKEMQKLGKSTDRTYHIWSIVKPAQMLIFIPKQTLTQNPHFATANHLL